MTTKYQRPNGAYDGVAALSNRTKYQNDAAQVPKVAISSSKIDGDFNYIIDALNTIDEAAGSRTTIAERLATVLNDDGSLKASAVAVLDEWQQHSVSNLTQESTTAVGMDGDQTPIYKAGRRVRVQVGGVYVYGAVATATYAESRTVVELTQLTDAAGSSATIGAVPTQLAYSPLSTAHTGNTPTLAASYMLRGVEPIFRVKDTSGSGKEYGLRSKSGVLEFLENTGSEQTPTWVTRGSVTATGLSIGDDSVTLAKLAHGTAGRVIGFNGSGVPAEVDPTPADGSISTAKIADNAVSLAKLAHGTANKLLGFNGSGVPAEVDAPTPAAASTTSAGIVELATAAETETATDLNRVSAVGNMVYHPCMSKAWVTFAPSGTFTVEGGANYSSVTDGGVGNWTVNWSITMSSSTYGVTYGHAYLGTPSGITADVYTNARTTTTTQVYASNYNGGFVDGAANNHITVSIWGELA